MPVAAPVTKKHCATNPYCPGCCGTLLFSRLRHQYPKDLPRVLHCSSRVVTTDMKEEGDIGEEFKMYDLVDVNRGLVVQSAYVHLLTRKGANVEPDMDHNYICLYKT